LVLLSVLPGCCADAAERDNGRGAASTAAASATASMTLYICHFLMMGIGVIDIGAAPPAEEVVEAATRSPQ
jgi:hypothetical protein